MESWNALETGRKINPPRITFSLSKTIRFNKPLIEEYDLTKGKYVQIYFKEESEGFRVAFEFLEEKKNKELMLSFDQGGSAFISGHSLLTTLNLDVSEMNNRIFEPKIEDMGKIKLLVIEIQKDAI